MPGMVRKVGNAPVEATGEAGDMPAQALTSRDLGVPDGPDDVTPEWLTKVLRRAGETADVRVAEIDVEPIADGRGFQARLFRLRLRVTGASQGASTTLVAKLAPTAPRLRAHLISGGTARELRFYADVAERAALRTPRCFYGAMDEAGGGSVLLLEDLTALRPGDNLHGCSLEDATLAVRQLARFHAQWWERLEGLDWMEVLFGDPAGASGLYRARWEPFLTAWGHLLSERARAIGERYASRGTGIWEQIAGPPHTIAHGDFRLDNLLFDSAAAPEPLAVVDWQGVRRGKGVTDLAYFTMSSLPPRHRRAWERGLVEDYHAALVEHGVRGYDLARCLADYQLARFRTLHTLVVVAPLFDFSHPRAHALLVAGLERLAALLDDDVRALLPT